ncbi:hypothetical protein [Nostoc sp. DedQUE09]|uniref:hypothetical protein n=1 Tax=Nostoc sp. DedQUE09 TaxID=3075394 RepID=UPI002AD4F31C|nr:hypothetical protein [Nostoc sp. DedQUE09]MDZ7952657.1 hypothetical protein [Nostoc sp. DedQUE09]
MHEVHSETLLRTHKTVVLSTEYFLNLLSTQHGLNAPLPLTALGTQHSALLLENAI